MDRLSEADQDKQNEYLEDLHREEIATQNEYIRETR